jgi:hypothetical protein
MELEAIPYFPLPSIITCYRYVLVAVVVAVVAVVVDCRLSLLNYHRYHH